MQEFLEKNWGPTLGDEESVRLTVKALLEVVDSGAKNMEIAVLKFGEPVKMLAEEQLQSIINDIEKEKEEAKKTVQDTAAMDI